MSKTRKLAAILVADVGYSVAGTPWRFAIESAARQRTDVSNSAFASILTKWSGKKIAI
jgi:hypothetical protein